MIDIGGNGRMKEFYKEHWNSIRKDSVEDIEILSEITISRTLTFYHTEFYQGHWNSIRKNSIKDTEILLRTLKFYQTEFYQGQWNSIRKHW